MGKLLLALIHTEIRINFIFPGESASLSGIVQGKKFFLELGGFFKFLVFGSLKHIVVKFFLNDGAFSG